MSVGIIIRPSGYSGKKSQTARFVPHFNRSIPSAHNPNGTYFRTKEEYYGTLKKMGLSPYDPTAKDSGKRKEYKASDKARNILSAIGQQTKKGKFKPSGNLVKAMEDHGVQMQMKKSDLDKLPKHYQKGGFNND